MEDIYALQVPTSMEKRVDIIVGCYQLVTAHLSEHDRARTFVFTFEL